MRHPARLLYIILFLAWAGGAGAQVAGPAAAKSGHPPKTVRLRQIRIAGNAKTRRQVILRELSIQEGQSISIDSMAALVTENKLRLANLALFTTIEIEPVVQDTAADWEITVRERWYIIPRPILQLADRNFNVWWSEMNRDPRRINAGLTLTDRNFRGNLEQLSVSGQLGYTRRFAVSYIRPYIDRSQRHGLGFSLSLAQSKELAYTTDSNKLRFARDAEHPIIRYIDAAVIYSFRPAYAVRHQLQLSYHDIRIEDTVLTLNPGFFADGSDRMQYLSLLYRQDQNRVDNWNYPLTGFKMVSYFLVRGGGRGARFQTQLQTEAGLFQNPLPKWYTSVIFRGRLSFPAEQPYFFRPAMGNRTEYVRGYEYYVADGSHYGILRVNLKREVLNRTLFTLPFRYLPSLPLRIYPKVFADAGYAYNRWPGNSFLNNRLLYSYGVGVDFVSTYDLKVRIEFARNHLGENGLFLHLNAE